MPDINELLGSQRQSQEAEDETENPLSGIQNAKGSPQGESETTLDSDELARMMMTGENSDGMISELNVPKKEDGVDLHEKPKEKAKVEGDKAESKGKYTDLFQEDMFKHPNKYFIETPEGRMTIAEAMRKGYNPITKKFDEGESRDAIIGRATQGLNEADAETVNRMLDPRSAAVAEGDASKYGLDPDSDMIRRPQQGQPEPVAEESPTGSPAPIGAQVEGGQTEATNPLAALMGGR